MGDFVQRKTTVSHKRPLVCPKSPAKAHLQTSIFPLPETSTRGLDDLREVERLSLRMESITGRSCPASCPSCPAAYLFMPSACALLT